MFKVFCIIFNVFSYACFVYTMAPRTQAQRQHQAALEGSPSGRKKQAASEGSPSGRKKQAASEGSPSGRKNRLRQEAALVEKNRPWYASIHRALNVKNRGSHKSTTRFWQMKILLSTPNAKTHRLFRLRRTMAIRRPLVV
jgi:hypothetical protein